MGKILCRPNDDFILLPLLERGPRLVGEFVQWHTKVGLARRDQVRLLGVQLRLHRGRDDLDDADVGGGRARLQLGAEGPGEGVEGRFGGAVVWAAGDRDEG